MAFSSAGARKIPDLDFVAAMKRAKPAPHIRKLRRSDIKIKQDVESDSDSEVEPSAKRANIEYSECKEDDDALFTHPIVLFLRDHTPVKPCARCQECRKPACGECANCKKNAQLALKSKERKRCITNGCSKLTEEELARYRRHYDHEQRIGIIEEQLRELRDRTMALQQEGKINPELESIREKLLASLKIIQEKKEAIEQVPDGYDILLMSVQALETERDRLARLIKRRAFRDSADIMKTRRQLRDYYGLKICELTKIFAMDMVAGPHVLKLIEIATNYEKK